MEILPLELQVEVASFLTFRDLKPFRLGNDFLARLGIVRNRTYLYKSEWMYVPCRILSLHYGEETLRLVIVVEEKRRRFETLLSPAHFHQLFLPLTAKVFPHVVSVSEQEMVVHMGSAFYTTPPVPPGALVDVMDSYGVWYEGCVLTAEIDRVEVHFLGWDERWNAWYSHDSKGIAPHRTFTRPWRHTLETLQLVEIRDMGRWHRAHIHAVNHEQSEVFVSWYVRLPASTIFFSSKWMSRDDVDLQPIGTHTYAYPYEGSYQHRFFCFHAWPRFEMHEGDEPLFLRIELGKKKIFF